MSVKKKDEEIQFENAVKRLEEVVAELESTDIDLERALKLYEEGIKLSRICNIKLSDAERKIEILKTAGSLQQKLRKPEK
ncbi:MAG: exodeoxyribonuclease VII small subunit [Chloroflexaceae bacterium]|nr:exodeoxyribonuclease VII small subunit [Chloroflexaceae bacterium]